ncbi:MAG: efflux RND transporter periplasmic adaptor subunit [Bacteroides sp.]
MKLNQCSLSWAFALVVLAIALFTAIGMILLHRPPDVLQGQVEATEIRISGKLPGRVDTFLVREGDWVHRGDTLVIINSPEIKAKFRQLDALEQVAIEQHKKAEAGTRAPLIAAALQGWKVTQSTRTLAQTTYRRIDALYRDSVVSAQRRDEAAALYQSATAAEGAAHEQYRLALLGAQQEDRASALSMVHAAQSTVDEVASLLLDTHLTAPADGQIATLFPRRGELVAPGTPLLSLVVMSDAHVVLNVREDALPLFPMGGSFTGDVPALALQGVKFVTYYISPLGSFATWKSTKQSGSYDMQTFEIQARPEKPMGLRPGMSVLVSPQRTQRHTKD